MRIDDGFSTIITFADFPTVAFYEKDVTPPGLDGGGANDTTTMRNTGGYRTRAPKKLKTATDISATVSYDPVVYQSVPSMINVNQKITVTFPDGSKVEVWGWLNSFTPNAAREGEQPTANIVIMCSNQNNANPPAVVAPTYIAA